MLFHCGETPLLATSVSPRPCTCFQVYALVRFGETALSACTFQVALATGISKTINKTIENTKQTRKPRFQDQRIAKTIEKTNNNNNNNNNKKTKISESMSSQNHRENQNKTKTRFQDQWIAKTIEKTNIYIYIYTYITAIFQDQ